MRRQTIYHHTKALRWGGATLIVLLLLTLLGAVGAQPSFADENPAPPSVTGVQPLVPNIEPEENGARVADALSASTTMTDTVTAVLAAFNQLPQPALPPDGALLHLSDLEPAGLSSTLAATSRVFIPVLLSGRTPSPAPDPDPDPDPGNGANVAVVLWPKPNIWAARGSILAYEIRLENTGSGESDRVRVTLPYNRQQFTLAYTSLSSSKGDWVSNIGDDRFTVTFGKLDSGERRSGTVYLRVANNLAQSTVISMRASYDWSDGRGGDDGRSNWAPVLVGGSNVDGEWLWLEVKPTSGRAGTVHSFFTDRFLPGEQVVTWLNTPDGVRGLDLRGTADSEGRIRLDFSSSGRRAGNYSLVLYGQRSHLTAVGGFVVQN